jgi:hypothetical protein
VTMAGLIATTERLEVLRDQLQADTLTATYPTRHGVVALVADGEGLRVFVNGEEVPRHGCC